MDYNSLKAVQNQSEIFMRLIRYEFSKVECFVSKKLVCLIDIMRLFIEKATGEEQSLFGSDLLLGTESDSSSVSLLSAGYELRELENFIILNSQLSSLLCNEYTKTNSVNLISKLTFVNLSTQTNTEEAVDPILVLNLLSAILVYFRSFLAVLRNQSHFLSFHRDQFKTTGKEQLQVIKSTLISLSLVFCKFLAVEEQS